MDEGEVLIDSLEKILAAEGGEEFFAGLPGFLGTVGFTPSESCLVMFELGHRLGHESGHICVERDNVSVAYRH